MAGEARFETIEEWLSIAWPVARALQAAHGRGVLHRSLRPGSLLVRKDATPEGSVWRVKVLDSGLGLKRTLIHATASHAAHRPTRRQPSTAVRCVRGCPFATLRL